MSNEILEIEQNWEHGTLVSYMEALTLGIIACAADHVFHFCKIIAARDRGSDVFGKHYKSEYVQVI